MISSCLCLMDVSAELGIHYRISISSCCFITIQKCISDFARERALKKKKSYICIFILSFTFLNICLCCEGHTGHASLSWIGSYTLEQSQNMGVRDPCLWLSRHFFLIFLQFPRLCIRFCLSCERSPLRASRARKS